MKVLVFNTTTQNAGLALLNGEQILIKRLETQAKHSESLLVEIENLLEQQNISVLDLDYVGVSIGPGSFTGIRLSLAILKGFLTANKRLKAVGFTTLELMERCYESDEKLAFVMNALSGKYYVAYSGEEPFLCYDIGMIDKKIVGLLEEGLNIVDDYVELDGSKMLELVLEKIQKGQTSSDLSPLYLRNSQAEENFNANRKNE